MITLPTLSLQKRSTLALTLAAALLMTGVSSATVAKTTHTYNNQTTTSNKPMPTVMLGYISPEDLPNDQDNMSPIRLQAIRDTATSLGAVGALAYRSQQINAQLAKNARQLDQVFDFNQLLIKNNVMPPVLSEANNSYNQASSDSIRLASKTYKIIKPAHFVTTPPNWREYLWSNFSKPAMPDATLLPKTSEEAYSWNVYLKQGWQQGVSQANAIFAANLARLKRDYKGMILYRKLLAQNIVSAPFVAKADLGVTGDANEIRINDQVLRITAHSQMQTDSSQWQPVLTHEQQPQPVK